MTRSKQREHAFLMLFRTDFHNTDELLEQDQMYIDEINEANQITQAENEFITGKVTATRSKISELDEMINERATGWSTVRMNKADLSIIRLALYEMLFDDSIPVGVAINEAVELAKKYGTDESPAFVNGILSKFVNK